MTGVIVSILMRPLLAYHRIEMMRTQLFPADFPASLPNSEAQSNLKRERSGNKCGLDWYPFRP